ncbi:glutathione-regulated potassium-efflux system protein KefC [Klebsiella michiganensis]|nr:glutathione-regulated potassium-efflux system protein KefC [Klebsiella michiganensis]
MRRGWTCWSRRGAEKAEVLINAIDDPQTNLQLAELAKEHFPHLQIISRARDVDHYIKLRQAGVEAPERETFEAALKSGRMTLEALGLGAYEAPRTGRSVPPFQSANGGRDGGDGGNDAASPGGGIQAHQRYADRHYQRRPQSFISGSASRAGKERKRDGIPGDIADEPQNKPSA